jgi:hypothetical protein
MRIFIIPFLLAGAAWSQVSLDANSILVNAVRTVALPPTDVSFMINVTVDFTVPVEQVLSAVDFGLTINDVVGISSYPGYTPYGPASGTRVTYTFRLGVPLTRMKETVDKLEKLRKATDTGVDLTYTTAQIGPSEAAVAAAREKALPELIADARARAQSIATAAQLKLGPIQAVNESNSYSYGYSGPLPPIVTFSAIVRFGAQ